MKSPAYHLRPNKAAERFALIEAIRHLPELGDSLDEYTYYGLGGPYLEDCRLLYDFYPEIPMVSVEENREVLKRQRFHKPCGNLTLERNGMKSFITQYQSNDKKSIFWLDYTRLEFTCFDEFKALLEKVPEKSMIKITLKAEPNDFWDEYKNIRTDKVEIFQREFREILPDTDTIPPREAGEFAFLLQKMLKICVQQALPGITTPLTFQPVDSFFYSDGTGMFTLTGVTIRRTNTSKVKKAFEDWEFANLDWKNRPRLIEIPILSTKERLHLQGFLPCTTTPGATLRAKLKYLIDNDIAKTESALEQYAAFHRYFPYYMRGTP